MEGLTESKVRNNLHVASDGVEAMAFLRREGQHTAAVRPDLILLDLNLPRMDGREVLSAVKSDPKLKTIPVVVLTTTDDSHEIKRCYELGCNVYITKPVKYESFANAIRQLGLFFSVIQVPSAAT